MDPRVKLDLQDLRDRRETKGQLAMQDSLEQQELLDNLDQQELMVPKVLKVHQEPKDKQVKKVLQETLGLLGR